MLKIWENNGTEEIGLVTPTPEPMLALAPSHSVPKPMLTYCQRDQCTRKTCMIHQTFVRWAFIWVRSQSSCLVTWFCYQLVAKPGNKTAAPSWRDSYILFKFVKSLIRHLGLAIGNVRWFSSTLWVSWEQKNSVNKIQLKILSAKRWPFWSGLSVKIWV